jgi:xylose isomerase
MRHFDAHAYRTEDEDGVWAFAAGCMRTYLILKEKAAQFAEDPEIQEILAALRNRGGASSRLKYTAGTARELGDEQFDLEAIRAQGYAYERLDQLTIELLLGVR